MGGAPRRLPIGTELSPHERGVHARVWAPTHDRVTLVIESPQRREVPLVREPDGHHGGFVADVAAGARYRFRVGDQLLADPASRFQPEGPFGPSQVIDPGAYAWRDGTWRGIPPARHVLYEMHVGTFTPEGTWAAAAEWLPYLADVGITTLEVMPVNEFAGCRNWGYDGVNLFAPTRCYGTPDDMRAFVDRAHAAGLAVILDVVYNHFGPAGNSMFVWSPEYRTDAVNEWGDALNFESPGLREFFIANAGYWIDEFHLDGLRIDATQAIHDPSSDHILAAIARRAREAGRGRQIFLVGENEPQAAELLVPPIELDALWNDDFHHTARIALTGLIDGYLNDYRGSPQELISAIERGFLYQGQLYPWQKQHRGQPTRGLAPQRFVHFLENHDQVANVGLGERLVELADPPTLRAMTALLLLTPPLPMLFQGQEHASTRPWLFFVDHGADLRAAVRTGRAEFVAQFARLATREVQARLPDPGDEATFRRCVLDPSERRLDHPMVALHRDLLKLRRDDPAFTGDVEGAVLGERQLCLRFVQPDPAHDRLLLLNLGPTFTQASVPEPRIAPPRGMRWRLVWSSEDPRYGGHGTPQPFTEHGLAIPGRSAIVLAPESESP